LKKLFNGYFAIGLVVGAGLAILAHLFLIAPCPTEDSILWFCGERPEVVLRVLEFIETTVAAAAWPIAALLIARLFSAELKELFSRIKKFKLSGAEFDLDEQTLIAKPSPNSLQDLEKFEGIERTDAIAELELQLHKNLEGFPEDSRLNLTVRELAQSRLDQHFSHVYQSIFGSQIRLLKRLRENGGNLSDDRVLSFFHNVQADYEFHEDKELAEYLQFLLNFNLIVHVEKMYELTDVGTDFLLYLFRLSLRDDKPL